ncbi:MAG TPA: prolipoprotein diacylglyceryl transferase [Candidatus Cloacimonadota bacterium]|nr:prolipoprotein diacylglyceryl transferase [Candidatus Cloacimonadota bacterium]HPT70715.1 prolipoprotein diacylglyceryl transferase [Candidatus Cloacimonadota bacterium]
MIPYPEINPEILPIHIFGLRLAVTWYGFLYVIAFTIAFIFYRYNLKLKNIVLNREQYENYIFVIMLGVIFGGRLGYILFYGLPYYISHPLHVFSVWEGGMSFHGGALGVVIAVLLYCRQYKIKFLKLADPSMPFVAIGLGLGRFGNFINGELFGRPTNVPWAMIFPNSDNQPRHPSQLYELFMEGIVLFTVTQWLNHKKLKDGSVFWIFFILYGIFRIIIEFFREPDQISIYKNGLLYGFLPITQGQFLSILMIIAGTIGMIVLYSNKAKSNA